MMWVSVSAFAQDTTRLSLLFLGDIMQHDSQIQSAYNPVTKKYEYDACFQFVKPYFESVDLAIGNLELTLAGAPFKGYPQFCAPDELAHALKNAGMDVLVTANNHSLDRGKKGVERTIKMLDSLGFIHTGTFRDSADRAQLYPLIIERKGFRLALLNYTYGTNGIRLTKPNIVNLIDTAQMHKDILKAQQLKPDMVIVFTHWGLEYQSQPSAEQKMLTELFFRWGVQFVIGSHPHVLQPMQWRKEQQQLVAYSLGNFISGQRPRYRNGGAMLRVELSKITKDSLATTQIDSAGYLLEWVYRTADSKQHFYSLPVNEFETDTTGFIKDETSKTLFKEFIDDSRKLFDQYNINLREIKAQPARKPEE